MDIFFQYLDPVSALLAAGICGIAAMYWYILKQFVCQSQQMTKVVTQNTAALTQIDGTLINISEKLDKSADRDHETVVALTQIHATLAQPLPRSIHNVKGI